eukprot:9360169-Lingulodinium_polyedra.AAC.1
MTRGAAVVAERAEALAALLMRLRASSIQMLTWTGTGTFQIRSSVALQGLSFIARHVTSTTLI